MEADHMINNTSAQTIIIDTFIMICLSVVNKTAFGTFLCNSILQENTISVYVVKNFTFNSMVTCRLFCLWNLFLHHNILFLLCNSKVLFIVLFHLKKKGKIDTVNEIIELCFTRKYNFSNVHSVISCLIECFAISFNFLWNLLAILLSENCFYIFSVL